ncbi:metallophosphoesterase family protein [Microbacterium indicum]|uniref:metallophosphoesterase family protein n=1 Tax=Microbacterium indicum TaxID=358100 RepID=UPI001B7FD996|nr:metallophosphoesterase family protein [Microbacterium indicum]
MVSDIHGNVAALEAVVSDIARVGVHEVLNLGDVASGALWPAETLELLMREGWRSARGNHDRVVVEGRRLGPSDAHARASLGPEQLAWMAALPERIDVTPGIVAVHGSPRADDEYLTHSVQGGTLRLARPAEVARRLDGTPAVAVLCGHTHLPVSMQSDDGTAVIGAGSVGLQAYEDDAPPSPHLVQNGTPDASYVVIDFERAPTGARIVGVQHRRVSYDHEAAARRAETVGRPDVAVALRTGQVS